MKVKPVNVAVIGIGSISDIYLSNLTDIFKDVKVIGVCSHSRQSAENAGKKYGIPNVYETMLDAFNDSNVELILNLTRPDQHYEVTKAALLSGKHVYSEKPIAGTLEEGKELAQIAKEKGLMLGGAPDTFMGAGIQTCRKLIDDGFIGDVVGTAAFMICHGHESWHPNPDFYYQPGGGPMFDMGPYYLTAMINLAGGVDSVMCASKKSFEQRVITSKPLEGNRINVNVDTYVAGTVKYKSGAIGTLFTTFDAYYPNQTRFEVYGSRGTLFVSDPNGFAGSIKLLRPEDKEIRDMPYLFDYSFNSRGLGLDDMAVAIRTGRRPRADLAQTLHVLNIMCGFEESSKSGQWVKMTTQYERGMPMRNLPLTGRLD